MPERIRDRMFPTELLCFPTGLAGGLQALIPDRQANFFGNNEIMLREGETENSDRGRLAFPFTLC